MSLSNGFLKDKLLKRTPILGLHIWVLVGICLGASFLLLLLSFYVWITLRRSGNTKSEDGNAIPNSVAAKDVPRISVQRTQVPLAQLMLLPESTAVNEQSSFFPCKQGSVVDLSRTHVEVGKDCDTAYSDYNQSACSQSSWCDENHSNGQVIISIQEVPILGWGHWYTLRELEDATNEFSNENVIGEGGYGIVYRGVLVDNSMIAVKCLLNNRGQAEKEFKVEIETLGHVRHKNLVKLLGYCMEGVYRLLVYEYVDNGNLELWLHGDVQPCDPLSWEIRMNVVVGTAKGLTYLHEGLEPKVIHRDIKSSNVLLDKQWNPKVSDFGLAKLIGSEKSFVTTRVMGTFGYVAPEYASTGMLNESSDVYSFGILIMEIISGRSPVDYSRPQGEVSLLDWVKTMIRSGNIEGLLDPKIPEKPTSRALKRTILVALRCVDPDAQLRPKMGRVLHMLEAEDFPFRDACARTPALC